MVGSKSFSSVIVFCLHLISDMDYDWQQLTGKVDWSYQSSLIGILLYLIGAVVKQTRFCNQNPIVWWSF